MHGRGTVGLVRSGPIAIREAMGRMLSRWVLLALLAELILAVVDLSIDHTSVLTSVYLVPVLALALVETGERTAALATVAFLLAVLSGIGHGNALTSAHVYRMAIVAGAGALGALGATFRSRALLARDRMEMLASVGEIADGTRAIDDALRRLADVLVPGAADLCELIVLDGDEARSAVTRLYGATEDAELARAQRPSALNSAALAEIPAGEGLFLRSLPRTSMPAGSPLAEAVAGLRAVGMTSAILSPVRASAETVALLVMAVGPSGRRYRAEDLRFAQTVGSRAALAIQNARLVGELGETHQRLEAIVGSLADAVTIRHVSGQLIYANAAALSSMDLAPNEDIRERDPVALFNQFIVTDERGQSLPMDRLPSVRLLAGEEPEPLVLRFVHGASGVEQWRVLKATPLYDAHGQLEAAVTIIEDVTASKRAELRSALLSQASAVLASSLDYEQTLTNVAWLAVPDIADWCAVDVVDEHGDRQRVVTAHRDPAKLELARRLQALEPEEIDPERGLGAVLRTGKGRLVRTIEEGTLAAGARSAEHLELRRQLQARSGLVVPLHGANRVVGAMTLVSAESGRTFSEEDLSFAEQLAARAGVAVENARLYSERSRIASILQHSLLPEALPRIEGWEVASLYRPASLAGEVEVGGDFYDAFATEAGWLLLIGDVTGKGVEAAAMTALVRHGARFVADYAPDPAEILARLDWSLRQQRSLSLCTALCLLIDGERIAFASAGHPLPLLVTDDGVRPVGHAGSMLGAFEDGDWPTHVVGLRPSEVLLLYTDGVTDTVGDAGRFGEQRLYRTMAECGPLAPNELLDCLDKALSRFQVGSQADDTAALALRLAGQPLRATRSAPERRAGS